MGPRSKTAATWIAIIGGVLGLHRFYLHGFRDVLGWLHPWPTLLGVIGVSRIRELGQDDRLAWFLVPLLGFMIAQAMLVAILHALSPPERWNARFNAGHPPSHTGGLAVFGAVVALGLGAGSLMATLAYTFQHVFELVSATAAG